MSTIVETSRQTAVKRVKDKQFKSFLLYVKNVVSENRRLFTYTAIYLAAQSFIFFAVTTQDTLLFKSAETREVQSLLRNALFILLFIILAATVRNFFFYGGLRFLNEPFLSASTTDILLSAFHFHPLWLHSSSISGTTMRNDVISNGLGVYTKLISRFSYVGPMVFCFLSNLYRICSMNVAASISFIAVALPLEFYIFKPLLNTANKEKDAGRAKRTRFTAIERMEYSKLQSAKTRGFREYKALTDRIVRYQAQYCKATLPMDFKLAYLPALSTILTETIAFAVTLWFVLGLGKNYNNAADAQPSDQSCSNTTTSSTTMGVTFVFLVNALRSVIGSYSQVRDHQQHTNNEIAGFNGAAQKLSTAFLTEDIDGGNFNRATLNQHVAAIESALDSIDKGLQGIDIDIAGGYVTTVDQSSIRMLMIEGPIRIAAGDLIIIRGPNGAGKSLFLAGLSGKYDGSMVQAIRSNKLREIGRGNTDIQVAIRPTTSDGAVVATSSMALHALSLGGCVREYLQAVESINFGEKDTAFLGDIMLRMNGLLVDCAQEGFRLCDESSAKVLFEYMVSAMEAAGLSQRLLGSVSSKEAMSKETLEEFCKKSLMGMSGGEQQRLQLASMFFVEKVRFAVKAGLLSPATLGSIEPRPMQLLLLDEPDQHVDGSFDEMLNALLLTLHPKHRQNLAIVLVLHKEIDKSVFTKPDESGFSFSPKQINVTNYGILNEDEVATKLGDEFPDVSVAFDQAKYLRSIASDKPVSVSISGLKAQF